MALILNEIPSISEVDKVKEFELISRDLKVVQESFSNFSKVIKGLKSFNCDKLSNFISTLPDE